MGNKFISYEMYQKGFKNSSVMFICSLANYFFIFVPNIIIAKNIGLGNITDAYLMAFSINQIIIKFIRLGTLPKIFMMVLSENFVEDKKKAEYSINNFLNISLLLSFLVILIIYFIAPILVGIIARGFDLDKKILTVNIMRVLAPLFLYQFIISLADSIFKLSGEFGRWALLRTISPLIITLSVYFYISKFGIYSMVYGTLIGSFVHLAILLYYIYFKFKYSYRFILDFKHKSVKEIPVLLYPYYLSSAPVQILLGVQSFLASLLPAGFASVYFYAIRLPDFAGDFSLSIFSEIALPYFIKKMVKSSIDVVKNIYAELICFINYAMLPILIILAVFARQAVEILFRSKFTDPHLIYILGISLSYLFIFLLPEPSNNIQFNMLLGMKKTLYVNMVNISRMLVVITLSIILFRYYKFWGLIFSYSLTNLQGFLVNQWYLKKKYSFENILINPRFLRILFLNLMLAIFCFKLNHFILYNFYIISLSQKIISIAAGCSLSIIFYGLISYLFKNEELKILVSLVRKY